MQASVPCAPSYWPGTRSLAARSFPSLQRSSSAALWLATRPYKEVLPSGEIMYKCRTGYHAECPSSGLTGSGDPQQLRGLLDAVSPWVQYWLMKLMFIQSERKEAQGEVGAQSLGAYAEG